jgi:hypothetical protein
MTIVVASHIFAYPENLVTNKQWQAFHLRVSNITLPSTDRCRPTDTEHIHSKFTLIQFTNITGLDFSFIEVK